jgi:uncharacterized protein YecT (DUF1311 family)
VTRYGFVRTITDIGGSRRLRGLGQPSIIATVKQHIRYALCIALLCSASAATAMQSYERFRVSDAESERLMSADYRRCMDASGGVTANMRDCAEAEGRRLDARLNAAYRDAMTRLPTSAARTRLRLLERRWVATRYHGCERSARSERGGTLWLVMMDGCSLDEDVRRILWLERYGRHS